MDLLRRNPLMAVLGLLCIVLAVAVIAELATPGSSTHAAAAKKVAPAEAKLLPPVAFSSVEQLYPETAARPLWIPTRRPAPTVVAAPASFQRGQFVLQGITIAGSTRIALLKEKASGRIHRVEQGRDLNGLQVAEVQPETVTLVQGGEREVISLAVQRPAAPGTPGQPAPAAQSGGPFASAPAAPGAPAPAPPAIPGIPPGVPPPGAPPSPSPFGQPLVAPTVSPGPLTPGVANPSATTVPQQATTAPMTPEELLARRRARRNATPQ
jgi:hypothetical protein